MTNRGNDRTLIYLGVAGLVFVAALFGIYSFKTSDTMDKSAASAGSSTSGPANTLQDKAGDKPPGSATTGINSNVPPATAPSR